MTGRQGLGLAIVTLTMGFVGVSFLRGAENTAEAGRTNACRAMRPDAIPAPLVGKEAPDFQLKDASGKVWSLKALRGRPVLLNFWATWCPPCVEEIPGMEELARRVGDRAVVLAVSVDEDWDTVKRFFPRGTSLSVLLDTSKNVPKSYGTEKYPETFLIGADGQIKHAFISQRKWDAHEAALCLEGSR
jgi:peroxiredoxin